MFTVRFIRTPAVFSGECREEQTHLVKQVNYHGDEVGVDDGLHLLLVACCDVGQEPHCLLQDSERTYKSDVKKKEAGVVLQLRRLNTIFSLPIRWQYSDMNQITRYG